MVWQFLEYLKQDSLISLRIISANRQLKVRAKKVLRAAMVKSKKPFIVCFRSGIADNDFIAFSVSTCAKSGTQPFHILSRVGFFSRQYTPPVRYGRLIVLNFFFFI